MPVVFLKEPFQPAFYRAMTVMVVASPCALIISTPASILSAIGGAARRGVLFKGGVHLERTATVKVVALDKTGTLTEGKPRVTDVIVDGRIVNFRSDADGPALDLLQHAATVEAKSEHPLAQAIVSEARGTRAAAWGMLRLSVDFGKGRERPCWRPADRGRQCALFRGARDFHFGEFRAAGRRLAG